MKKPPIDYEAYSAERASKKARIDALTCALKCLIESAEYALRVGYKSEDCGEHCGNGCYWCELRNAVAKAKEE